MPDATEIELSEATSPEKLAKLRRDYLAQLAAPFDGMWEVFAGMARQLAVHRSGELVGYAAVDADGQVLQFHLDSSLEHLAPEVFTQLFARPDVRGAIVSTADPLFLGQCLDRQRSVRVHTYLYRNQRPVEPPLAGGAQGSFDLVEPVEVPQVVELQRASLEQDPGDWLVGYVEGLVARRELYALRLDGEILATGEARRSDSQPPFVDLGVITMRDHRGQGVAGHVLGQLKRLCHERDLVPICSTTVENVASRGAIARAGFVTSHRLLEIGF